MLRSFTLITKLINLNRFQKQSLMLTFDVIIILGSLWLAFSIRLEYWFKPSYHLTLIMLCAPLIAIPIFIRFGLYRAIVRYIGIKSMWTVFKAVSLYALVWGLLAFMSGIDGIPRSVIAINWLMVLISIAGSRILARSILSEMFIKSGEKKVLIYGAGEGGRQLAEVMLKSGIYNPVAFIDDNKDLIKQNINDIKVYSSLNIKDLIDRHQVKEVILTFDNSSREKFNQIINKLKDYSVHVRILPSVSDLVQGRVKIDDIREVSVDDILGRDKVAPNLLLLHTDIKDKVVMVTGAGGSIGSELCRQIVALRAKKLILFEQNELALYSIDQELIKTQTITYPILGSVVNQSRIERICRHFCVDTIYHAAAYKHVPMVEFNSTEGVINNIFGTLYCAQAAINTEVRTFVLISTDKAVRPTNTMGASKRVAELVLQALAECQHKTRFSMVRFGNVLGSSGSVIPLFRKQIQQGGPLTVTHKNIMRYFMTIPEAVELVIQAGSMAHGGEVFVLDMGEPVRIFDLATKMIHLSGLSVRNEANPEGDIEISITGLRPGEKLFEELLIGDNITQTDHKMIMKAKEDRLSWQELEAVLAQMQIALEDFNQPALRELLKKVVPGFKPQCDIEDILYQK